MRARMRRFFRPTFRRPLPRYRLPMENLLEFPEYDCFRPAAAAPARRPVRF